MVSLKKYVACKCGANNSFDFSSDLQVEDLTLFARCPLCGSVVHISVSSMLSPPQQPSAQQDAGPTQEQADAETKANVEQAVRDLFR